MEERRLVDTLFCKYFLVPIALMLLTAFIAWLPYAIYADNIQTYEDLDESNITFLHNKVPNTYMKHVYEKVDTISNSLAGILTIKVYTKTSLLVTDIYVMPYLSDNFPKLQTTDRALYNTLVDVFNKRGITYRDGDVAVDNTLPDHGANFNIDADWEEMR